MLTFARKITHNFIIMFKFQHFTESEIPYDILEGYGLTQEMIDDLPQSIFQRLLAGYTTPLLPILTKDAEGNTIDSLARVTLFRRNDGKVDVGFVPQWEEKSLDEYDEETQQKLLNGDVCIVYGENRQRCFVQYDEVVRQTITVPVELILHNISIVDELKLSSDEINKISNGNIVEIMTNNVVFSIGIDLVETAGFRVAIGDAQTWREEAKMQLPEYNFGIMGCWVRDQIKNTWSYVPEEKYTEEMNEEMKRIGQQRAAQVQMRGMRM